MIENSTTIQNLYNLLSDEEKTSVRNQIIEKAGISLPQFYYILRKGTRSKLLKETFAKYFKSTPEKLFQN
jgi:hypothetical protein